VADKPKKLPPKSKVAAVPEKGPDKGLDKGPAKGGSSAAGEKGRLDDKPKKLPPKSKVSGGGRVTAKGGGRPAKTKISRYESAPEASSRYTPPTPHYDEMPSPLWVPILMFTMFALGMLVIFLNYVELLPGATTNWYLLVGLGLILGGIITATQYR
jgi:hypothetical protein